MSGRADTDRPLISIVINNYNYARFLAEAVDSALAQTYPRTEVIVVDDGSTDESREILRRYGDEVRCIFKENGGQASALNAGFDACRGELVMFLDSDDVLLPEAAEEVARVWRDGAAKIQFPLELMDADGTPRGVPVPPDPPSGGDVRALLLETGGYAATGTTGVAFHRPVLERLLPIPEEEWRRQADVYLLLLSPFCGEIITIPRILGRYRSHGANNWAMEELDLDRLREGLDYAGRREKLLRDRLPEFGWTLPPDWRLRSPQHIQTRLTSLRLDADRHPHREDRAWRLALHGVRASWTSPVFSRRKRIAFSLWFVLMALAPRPLAARLAVLGLLRGRRSSFLQRLVSR